MPVHAENPLLQVAGKLFNDVTPMLHEFRAVFDQIVWTERGLRSDVAWHGKDLAALFVGQPRSDQRSTVLRRLDDQNAETESAQDSIAIREVLRQWRRAQWEFRNHRPARRDLILQLLVLFRIGRFQPRPDDGDCLPARFERATMRRRVDSARQS